MSGRVYQFGLTTLPGAAARWSLPAHARSTLVDTLGGKYDPERSDRSGLSLQPVTVSALAYAATQAALGASLDDYRAMLGKRDRLWLKPHDTTQVDRWCWARLAQVNETPSVYNRITQPVDLVFQPLSGWNGHAYGGAWDLDAGYYFDNGLYLDSSTYHVMFSGEAVTITNAGNRTVTNLGISTLFSTNVSYARFVVPSLAQFSYEGAITAGSTLTIDCGAKTVLLDGVDAYDYFTIGPNQYSADWLPLAPGNTSITLYVDADFPTAPHTTFVYSDGWI